MQERYQELLAGVVSIAIAAWSRRLLLTIALGMSLFLLLGFFSGS